MSTDHLPVPAADGKVELGKTYEVSFDHELDPEPPRRTVLVDVADKPASTRRPIIPVHLRTWPGVRRSARDAAALTGYRVGYHALRAVPMYLPLAAFWSVVGVFRLLGRAARWGWAPELSALLQHAASSNDIKGGVVVNRDLSAARTYRGLVLLAGLAAAAGVASYLVLGASWWERAFALAVLVPWLAHVGRPADHPIISVAVIAWRTGADIVTAAAIGFLVVFLATLWRNRTSTIHHRSNSARTRTRRR